LQADTEL